MTFITDIVSSYVHEAEVSAIKEMAMLGARVEGAASLAWGLPPRQAPEFIQKLLDRDAGAGCAVCYLVRYAAKKQAL